MDNAAIPRCHRASFRRMWACATAGRPSRRKAAGARRVSASMPCLARFSSTERDLFAQVVGGRRQEIL